MKKIGVCPSCHKDFVVDTNQETIACPYCGSKFARSQIPLYADKTEPAKSVPTPAPKKSHTGLIVALVLIGVVLAVPFGLLIGGAFNGKSLTSPTAVNQITERAIQSGDYSTSGSEDLTSYTVTITPTRDIKTFSVSLSLFNSKNSAIFSDTETKTYLSRGSAYAYKFDFGFVNSLSGSYVRCTFAGVVSLV